MLPAVHLAEWTTLPVVEVTWLTADPAVLVTLLTASPAMLVAPLYVCQTTPNTWEEFSGVQHTS